MDCRCRGRRGRGDWRRARAAQTPGKRSVGRRRTTDQAARGRARVRSAACCVTWTTDRDTRPCRSSLANRSSERAMPKRRQWRGAVPEEVERPHGVGALRNHGEHHARRKPQDALSSGVPTSSRFCSSEQVSPARVSSHRHASSSSRSRSGDSSHHVVHTSPFSLSVRVHVGTEPNLNTHQELRTGSGDARFLEEVTREALARPLCRGSDWLRHSGSTPEQELRRPQRPRRTTRARETDNPIFKGSGRSSTQPRGISKITTRASACRPAAALSRAARSYQPAALKKRQENFQSRATLDPESKCFLPGVPRITYMPHPFQIVQQRDKVTFLYEYLGAVRFAYMNGNPHPKGPIEWFMGDSRARFDGNTLVVDVMHFTDQTWLDRAGNFPAARPARRRTAHADRAQPHALRGHDRSKGVHEALEDQHALVSTPGRERRAPRI